jgi:hypothetical protein
MQFTALPLLALAASASAAIAKPGWNVTSTYRPISQQATYYDLTLVFVSDDYPAGIKSQCTWSQLANPTDPIECNPSSVSIERPEGHSKYSSVTETYVCKELEANV